MKTVDEIMRRVELSAKPAFGSTLIVAELDGVHIGGQMVYRYYSDNALERRILAVQRQARRRIEAVHKAMLA